MASFHAVPTLNPCESLQQQPASLVRLVKPPGPSHVLLHKIYWKITLWDSGRDRSKTRA